MTNWKIIQEFEAGASPQTCKMGGSNYPQDHRGYGDALRENGYPLIRQWIEGKWDASCFAEYGRFLQTAIAHGSFPMLAIAAIGAASNPDAYDLATGKIDEKTKEKLASLVRIGSIYDVYGKYIKELEHVRQEHRVQQAAS